MPRDSRARAAVMPEAAVARPRRRGPRALSGGLDVFYGDRREIVAPDLGVDDRKRGTAMCRFESAPQFGRIVDLETCSTPVLAQSRIRPRWNIEQVAPLARHRPEDAPSAIVDHDHDRIR